MVCEHGQGISTNLTPIDPNPGSRGLGNIQGRINQAFVNYNRNNVSICGPIQKPSIRQII